MKKLIAGLLVAGGALLIPSMASAHTGSVTCGPEGVEFSYQANFPTDTVVTEDVNGVTKLVTVKANTASTDTVTATSDHVLVQATWVGGGSIPPTDLSCTAFVPPVCVPTETVTHTVYTPGPETVQYIPYEVPVTKFVVKTKVKYRNRWHVVYRFIKYKPVRKSHSVPTAGVAG